MATKAAHYRWMRGKNQSGETGYGTICARGRSI